MQYSTQTGEYKTGYGNKESKLELYKEGEQRRQRTEVTMRQCYQRENEPKRPNVLWCSTCRPNVQGGIGNIWKLNKMISHTSMSLDC